MEQASHVFIVGIPRSGTTLLRQVLNLAPEVAICPETHFFGSTNIKSFIGRSSSEKGLVIDANRQGFQRKYAHVDWTTEQGSKEMTDLLYGLDRAYSRWLKANIDREQMRAHILATKHTDRALFDAMMTIYANAAPIRGEKTPTHLFYVPTLIDWFPQAKIIHIIRDPRAVYVSHKKKWKSEKRRSPYHQIQHSDVSLLLYITTAWLQASKLHLEYAANYPGNYYSCNFEDFTLKPRNHLSAICDFIGIEFRSSMLHPENLNSGFLPENEKSVGFDTKTNVRWRQHIHPITNLWFKLWTRKYRQRHH